MSRANGSGGAEEDAAALQSNAVAEQSETTHERKARRLCTKIPCGYGGQAAMMPQEIVHFRKAKA
jgi:hypothetical protein